MDRDNVIVRLTFDYALLIIDYASELEELRKFVIANQVLKSGTSIGANVNEAQSAESRKDFIHKLKIADKEVKETKYWLSLCKYAKNYPFRDELLTKLDEIQRVLGKIIITSIKKLNDEQAGK